MTMEHRVRDALSKLDSVEPSLDLWARVAESIEEDTAHRRRIKRIVFSAVALVASLVAVGWMALSEKSLGHSSVDWRVMEILETVTLLILVLALGPAVRRFGDGYAGYVFRANPSTGTSFLRLLDVAYYLVFGGFIAATAQLVAPLEVTLRWGTQLMDAIDRVGGLLLLMGLLHAVTFMVLPLLGLVFTAVWRQLPLPRWVNVLLVLFALGVGLQLLDILFVVVNLGLM